MWFVVPRQLEVAIRSAVAQIQTKHPATDVKPRKMGYQQRVKGFEGDKILLE